VGVAALAGRNAVDRGRTAAGGVKSAPALGQKEEGKIRPTRCPGRLPPDYQPPILKLELTWKTALTMAKAMNPTKMNTAMSTPLAITLVNMLSWLEICFW